MSHFLTIISADRVSSPFVVWTILVMWDGWRNTCTIYQRLSQTEIEPSSPLRSRERKKRRLRKYATPRRAGPRLVGLPLGVIAAAAAVTFFARAMLYQCSMALKVLLALLVTQVPPAIPISPLVFPSCSALNPRPPYEDLEPKVTAGLVRWVSNNDDVVREKQNAHIRRVSSQVRHAPALGGSSGRYVVVWKSVNPER